MYGNIAQGGGEENYLYCIIEKGLLHIVEVDIASGERTLLMGRLSMSVSITARESRAMRRPLGLPAPLSDHAYILELIIGQCFPMRQCVSRVTHLPGLLEFGIFGDLACTGIISSFCGHCNI